MKTVVVTFSALCLVIQMLLSQAAPLDNDGHMNTKMNILMQELLNLQEQFDSGHQHDSVQQEMLQRTKSQSDGMKYQCHHLCITFMHACNNIRVCWKKVVWL